MAVVIYTEKDGVYLGTFWGMGFWSKIDPVGQPAACTFPDEKAAREHMNAWECGPPEGVLFPMVNPDQGSYASVDACVVAGLPAWEFEPPDRERTFWH